MDKNRLIEICNNLGIDTVGIAPVGPYTELKKF